MGATIVGTILLVFFGFCAFVLSGYTLGHSEREYRCIDGITESRTVIWGQPMTVFSAVEGYPC